MIDKSKLPKFPPIDGYEVVNESQAIAWGVLWTWCHENGLSEYAAGNTKLFRELDGPQTIAQWILDLKENQK